MLVDHKLTHFQKRLCGLVPKISQTKETFTKASLCQNHIIIYELKYRLMHHSELKLAFSRKLNHFQTTSSKTKPLPPTKAIISRYSIEIKRGKRNPTKRNGLGCGSEKGVLKARLFLSFSFQLVVRYFILA